MELFFAILLLLIPLRIAYSSSTSGEGWMGAWSALFLLSATFGILGYLIPGQATLASRLVLVAASVFLVFKGQWRGIWKNWSPFSIPIFGGVFLVCAHGYFPAFDVDSTMYHIPGITWLLERPHLPLFQQRMENVSLWFCWIAFEEFLFIPGSGLDLALFSGLVGTVLKVLSLLTVVGLVPRRIPSLRYLAMFLVLIDDHFFFSGQNRFVYINPSLIGLVALLGWHSWRAAHGRVGSLYSAIALSLAMPAVKYHGLYFSMGAAVIVGLGRVILIGKGRIAPPRPDRRHLFFLFASMAIFTAVMGPHFWFGGSPLFPFSLGPFKALLPNRGIELLAGYADEGSFLSAASHPIRLAIYPGILALKMTVVLFFLLIPAWSCFILLPKAWKPRARWLSLASLGFTASILWPIVAEYLKHEESRYPRYVYGLSIISICAFALSFHRIWRRTFGKILPLKRTVGWLELAGGGCVLLWLIATVDSRYFNVLRGQRPHWENIRQLVSWRGGNSIDPEAPHMAEMMLSSVYSEIPPLRKCLQSETEASGVNLLRGDSLVLFSPYSTFPAHLLAPVAVQGSMFEGGGYLRLSGGAESLHDLGLRYAVLPKDSVPSHVKIGAFTQSGVFVPLRYEKQAICESPQLKLVKIAH